jgi:hypothetical protein
MLQEKIDFHKTYAHFLAGSMSLLPFFNKTHLPNVLNLNSPKYK